MSKKEDLIEKVTKSKQFNVLLWFVVALIIGGVCYFLFQFKSCGDEVGEILDSHEVSMTQIQEIRETIKNEYVSFSDMNTRVIDSLSQDGMLWGKNYLIQSAISCVEIGFDLAEMKIAQDENKNLIVNLGKPKILNSTPNGMTKPLVVRFEGYLQSDGDWTAADKMKLQEMINDKMLKKCEEWNYFQKAKEKAFDQIKLLIQHKLDDWQKKDITIIIEE
ncbi:MAG: DUF4230 domain-containing protein [Bacteroidales bacterium]|nr:DUF4230 domain-containing protein [Bacteroidales bacterium]